jgi:hypothetical protein
LFLLLEMCQFLRMGFVFYSWKCANSLCSFPVTAYLIIIPFVLFAP